MLLLALDYPGFEESIMQTTPAVLVQLQDLCKVFEEGRQTRTVLDGVTASFARGEFVVLLGVAAAARAPCST